MMAKKSESKSTSLIANSSLSEMEVSHFGPKILKVSDRGVKFKIQITDLGDENQKLLEAL